jgi:hypothetical protein
MYPWLYILILVTFPLSRFELIRQLSPRVNEKCTDFDRIAIIDVHCSTTILASSKAGSLIVYVQRSRQYSDFDSDNSSSVLGNHNKNNNILSSILKNSAVTLIVKLKLASQLAERRKPYNAIKNRDVQVKRLVKYTLTAIEHYRNAKPFINCAKKIRWNKHYDILHSVRTKAIIKNKNYLDGYRKSLQQKPSWKI